MRQAAPSGSSREILEAQSSWMVMGEGVDYELAVLEY